MGTSETSTDAASVARAYLESIAKRDLEAMIAYWEPGGIANIQGLAELRIPDTYREWFGGLFAAFPDFHFEILDLIAAGEQAAVRWRATGTFDGPTRFRGLVPNGARVDLGGCDLLTIRDGKIQRNEAYLNGAQMAQQLGALPPLDSFPERAMTAVLNLKTHAARRLRRR
jgi:predicted ester cyclase